LNYPKFIDRHHESTIPFPVVGTSSAHPFPRPDNIGKASTCHTERIKTKRVEEGTGRGRCKDIKNSMAFLFLFCDSGGRLDQETVIFMLNLSRAVVNSSYLCIKYFWHILYFYVFYLFTMELHSSLFLFHGALYCTNVCLQSNKYFKVNSPQLST
jgi:hypothetical protein